MGKRSSFERRERDFYATPPEAVIPLLPHLEPCTLFAEPCAGDGALTRSLGTAGHRCVWASDVEPQAPEILLRDARWMTLPWPARAFITNPPWQRPLIHEIAEHLSSMLPTWLLFDADWMHTKQSAVLIKRCSKVVSVGRVRWIEGTKHDGKDNCCWYLFEPGHEAGPHFYGR